MIHTIEDIIKKLQLDMPNRQKTMDYLVPGYVRFQWLDEGHVNITVQDELALFNYSAEAQFSGEWPAFETMCRGLIINWKTGEIVCRPLDKFFNWLQGGRRAPYTVHMVNAFEKMDGSNGNLYRQNGEYKIATRGSLQSDQALWATDFLNANYNLNGLDEAYTLIFEIIYPTNRIVVDYGDRTDLVLLAVRNRHTGEELPFYPQTEGQDSVYTLAQHFGFTTPKVYNFNSVVDIIDMTGKINANEEGWVVVFSDGSRYKFKGDDYLEVHRFLSGFSFKKVIQAIQNGSIDEMKEATPDELYTTLTAFIQYGKAQYDGHFHAVRALFEQVQDQVAHLPESKYRKAFAQALYRIAPDKVYIGMVFAFLDGKDLSTKIWKLVLEQSKVEEPTSDGMGAYYN